MFNFIPKKNNSQYKHSKKDSHRIKQIFAIKNIEIMFALCDIKSINIIKIKGEIVNT